MDKLTITRLEKTIYRFLDICKIIINKHEENQYVVYYTGYSLDFLHPYASCRLSVPTIQFDLFAGVEVGLYAMRQTPTAVYELQKIGNGIPTGYKYINFDEIVSRVKFGLSVSKEDCFKASTITDNTGILFADDDVKILNKFDELKVSYIENSNTLYFVSHEEYAEEVYKTEIIINPQNDLLLSQQLELGELYAKE